MARRKKTIVLKTIAGQPRKAVPLDEQSIEEKAYRESQKFDAALANKVHKLYKQLEQIAFAEGEFKDASITSRKSATEALIERVEDYLYEEVIAEGKDEEEEHPPKPHVEEEKKPARLISIFHEGS